MNWELREVDNGWMLSGHNGWHGKFEIFCATFARALTKMASMKKLAERKLA